MPSIKDVAKLAGCSTSTVSRVLNNRDAVDPNTRQKVLDAVQELDYKPNLVAQGLRVRKGNLIGVVVPNSLTHSFNFLLYRIVECARQQGYSVIFGDTQNNPNNEEAFIDDLLRRHVDGIIFSRVSDESRILPKLLLKKNVPFVVIDRALENEKVPTVVLNNYQAGRLAAIHLVELGHRKIACVTGPLKIGLCRERLKGFQDVLQEHDIHLGSDWVFEGKFVFQSGIEAVEDLCRKHCDFSAIWVVNDVMAFGVLKELLRKGIRVPADVSLMGLDDMDFGEMISPTLTTIHYPFDQMAEKAVELIIRQSNGEDIADEMIVLTPSLVIRESTGRYRER
jgi:DNA-binding LacI/PurR family transcriptional regulator